MELLYSLDKSKDNHYKSVGDKLLMAKVRDMLVMCLRDYFPYYTAFLDERQSALIISEISGSTFDHPMTEKQNRIIHYADLRYNLWGGYEDAGRKILCVHNEFYSDESRNDFPISCLTFRYRKSDVLSHRDFLGAIMSLQVKREAVGDIVVSQGMAQVLVLSSVSGLLLNDILKIGSVGVAVSADEQFFLEKRQEYSVITGTIASLRLDAVVSTAIKQSREKSVQIIKAANVTVNYFPTETTSSVMKKGDIFSVRGFGRFILSDIIGISKKGRIHIEIKKYL